MNLSEPFIKRPVGTSLLAIGLALLGITAYHFLPVASLPRVDFPVINVSSSLPGGDPATMASAVAAPLERRLSQISGITELTSASNLGSTSISIQFDLSRNINSAARDVQAAINAAVNDLPTTLPSNPTYRKINPADAPIMILALQSETLTPSKLYEAADQVIGQKLCQVEGVSQVNINGAEKSAVRVQIQTAALAATSLSLEDLRTFLGSVNVNAPLGSLESDSQALTLQNNGQLFDADLYRNLVVTQTNGTPITLNALGKVINGVENQRLAAWAGNQPAVLMIIFKQPGANVIETVDRIKAALPQLQKWISPAIETKVIMDRTQTIRGSVEDVQLSLVLSIALVVMVIFLFLRRFWPTFIASITVPLSLAGTFGGMYLLHYSIDNLSLMAITVSVGFVVDDAIVVIENVFRHVEAGDNVMQAALKGARQIGFTVISMSTSLVAVFIPLLFMGGLIGRLFHEFAVTLSLAILVSGVVSLTLTPMLCSRFLKKDSDYPPPGPFARALEAGFDRLLAGYERGLQWVLRHQVFMLGVTVATMVATVALYRVVPTGFFPQQDTGLIMGTTEAAQDVSFTTMARLQRRVAQIVMEDPAVADLGSFTGGNNVVNNGRMFISLKPLKERKISANQVINRLLPKLAHVEGITLFMMPAQDVRVGGRSSKTQFQYSLQCADLSDLNHWSDKLLQKLKSLPQLTGVTSDQLTGGLQANVQIDRDAASRLGVSPEDIDNTLYDAFGQRQVATLYGRYNQYHVVMEASPKEQMDPAMLNRIYVKSGAGKQVPLSAVAKFSFGNAYLSVNHQGQFPSVTLSFNLAPGVSLGEATELVQKAKEELRIPSRVQGSFQGTAQVFKASMSNMPLLFFASLVTVYIVLGMLYESLIHPITILSTLPSAGVGALLALIYCGYDLSLVSFIGIILLMGIVKKNAIMMVDFALDAERNQGMSPEEAVYQACIIRFRPIMMTTMAALLGSVPLAVGYGIGSELRRPLGIAVVGGLLFSQALTLYTTPVVYLFFDRLHRAFVRVKVRLSARRPRTAPAVSEAL
ncbi:MAG: efflux RND transporter permease subunit [Chthoniobacteraceae bacterium]